MAQKAYSLDFRGKEIVAAVHWAAADILTSAAFVAEGSAKTKAPVDTGFMRNALYGYGKGSGRGVIGVGAGAAKLGAGAGNRALAPAPDLGGAEAALHGAALYTIYQELAHGFMIGGIDEAKRQLPGIVKAVKL